jgi:hypothetical protein
MVSLKKEKTLASNQKSCRGSTPDNLDLRMKRISTVELMKHIKELIRYLKVSVTRMVDDDSPMTPPATKVFFKAFTQKFKILLGDRAGSAHSPQAMSFDGGNNLTHSGFNRADLNPELIQKLRKNEDLAEISQQMFKDKYQKFINYNEQNLKTL